MGVTFAKTSQPTNALYKFAPDFNWGTLTSLDCIFKEPVDELEPVIIVDTSNAGSALLDGNYCALSGIYGASHNEKFYWVKDRIYLGKNRIEYHLQIDPLYTYRRSIEDAEGVVEKFGGLSNNHAGMQSNVADWLERVDDGSLITGAGRSVLYYYDDFTNSGGDRFTNELGPDGGTYILGVVGGNSQDSRGLVNYYAPDSTTLNELSNWLTGYDIIDAIAHGSWFWQLFNNPIEAIVSLHKVFCTVNGDVLHTPYITFGSGNHAIDTGIMSAGISNRTTTIEFSAYIEEPLANYRAYEPYATAKIYLPFVGYVPFNPSTIYTGVNSNLLQVTYKIDVITGGLFCKVSRGGVPIGYYSGNCSVSYPVTANNAGLVLANITGSLAKTAVGVATGSVGLTSAGLGQLASTRGHTEVQGTLTGNPGVYGPTYPHIVVERLPYIKADDYEEHIGLTTNTTMRVCNCLNFVKYKEVEKIDYNPYLSGSPTLREREEIESYLRSGIVLPDTTRST